ncbi:hypothetical protein FOZ62_026217, partial [Perkinsus olseni]
MAVGYVINQRISGEGTDKLTKMSGYKLLLRCVMIITSVVPPELPMQMSLAVNTALMALHKIGVFCTEPYRVPMAGTITHCFFDKTGTLTTDQLSCTGVVTKITPSDGEPQVDDADKLNTDTSRVGMAAKYVIAGCHSLISIDNKNKQQQQSNNNKDSAAAGGGELLGDPVELAGLQAIHWYYDSHNNTAGRMSSKKTPTLKIITRHHFSSALQRMSAVVELLNHDHKKICVVKGSPETILGMLKDAPEGYLSTYRTLAKKGMRVLSMAFKEGPHDCDKWPRARVESELEFAGFITFACDLRNDTATVLKALTDAKMPCIMLTGDSALTAAHVANEIGIFSNKSEGKPKLMLTKDRVWQDVSTDEVYIPYTPSIHAVKQLASKADLVVGGDMLTQLEEEGDKTLYNTAHLIKVFARVSPQQKEEVVRLVKKLPNEDHGSGGDNMLHPLMCGDGGNDVGALKQADVGVALLSGFGDSNAASSVKQETPDGSQLLDGEGSAEDKLEEDQKLLAMRERQLAKQYKAEFNARRQVIMQNQQTWFQEELNKLTDKHNEGNVGFTTYFTAMKNSSARLRAELTKVQKELQQKYGTNAAWGGGRSKGIMASMIENAQKQVEDDASQQQEGMKPVVQLGDASVAAPFTSRAPSIRSVVQIIRQGRCTLLLNVQMMQIMMLDSMVSAYTLAAGTVEGGNATELQLIFSGLLTMVASIAFSYAKPADRLSDVLPIRSVFHPAIFLSVMAQVAVHLYVLVKAMDLAKTAMGDTALEQLYEFERNRDEKLNKMMDESGFGDDIFSMFKSVPYQPNLLNTVMFLVKSSQQVAVLVVNYKGRPWMQGYLENRALFLSAFLCGAGLFILASGIIPPLNHFLELMVLPDDLRNRVL